MTIFLKLRVGSRSNFLDPDPQQRLHSKTSFLKVGGGGEGAIQGPPPTPPPLQILVPPLLALVLATNH